MSDGKGCANEGRVGKGRADEGWADEGRANRGCANRGRARQVVFTVGNELRGDDAAGPLLARLLEERPIEGWEVIDGSSVPENHVHAVRRIDPERVVVIDAADMGLAVGEIRRLDENDVARHFLMTTHSLPLSFVLGSLRESITEVEFLGIQPRDTTFLAPASPQIREAVESLHAWLREGGDPACFPFCS